MVSEKVTEDLLPRGPLVKGKLHINMAANRLDDIWDRYKSRQQSNMILQVLCT